MKKLKNMREFAENVTEGVILCISADELYRITRAIEHDLDAYIEDAETFDFMNTESDKRNIAALQEIVDFLNNI